MKALFLRQGFDWVQESPEIAPKGVEVSHIDLTMAEFFDDQRLSDLAEQLIQPHEPDVLVIPVFLGNPTDYNGFRLAMHVRLTRAPGFNQPHIVLLTSESNDEFQRHCPYIRFLQSDKVTYIDYDHVVITRHLEKLTLENEVYRLDKNLHHFDIIKPDSDDDHHNLDGKLALLSWSEAIGCIDELNHLSGRFGTQLHFKVSAWTSRLDVRATNEATIAFGKDKHKILLIDDQVKDGWLTFFQSLFSSSQIELSHLDFNHLSKDSEEIVKRAVEKVSETDPDVVILDLRLCDSDAAGGYLGKELTGLRVLREIKRFNRGVQVIVLSASNKIWNLKPAYDLGSRKCIVKNPHDKDALIQLVSALNESISICHFHKDIFTRLSLLKTLIENDNNTSPDFKDSAKNSLTVAYDLIEMSEVESNYINYSYLHLYKLIEDWVGEYTETRRERDKETRTFSIIKPQMENVLKGTVSSISFDSKKKKYIYAKGKYEGIFVDMNYKMSALLIYFYGEEQAVWSKVRDVRNSKCGHSNQINDSVTKEELLRLVEFLGLILKGPPSHEEKLAKLASRFKSK